MPILTSKFQNRESNIWLIIFAQSVILLLMLMLLFFKVGNSLLVLNDHYIILGNYRIDYFCSQITYDDFGLPFSINAQTVLLDRLIYKIAYKFTSDYILVQKIKLSLTILVFFNLSLLGIYRLGKEFAETLKISNIYIVFLFYTLNNFCVIFWNTGIFFSMQQAIAYAIIPLAFCSYYTTIIKFNKRASYIKLSLFSFLISIVPYIAYVYLIVLFIFTFCAIILNETPVYKYMIRIGKAAICFIPLAFANFPVILQLIGGIDAVNSNHVQNAGMTGALKGGFLSLFKMWFWWPIYNRWEPRSILSFDDYILSFPFVLSALVFYGLAAVLFLKQKNNYVKISFLCVLLCSLFFGKGPQEPFGAIFNLCIEKVPLWEIVRTPDNKFAVGIVFALTCVFLVSEIGEKIKIIMLVALLIQAYPMLSGEAIMGKNNDKSIDRIINMPKEYFELANFLNNNDSNTGSYILPIPASGFDVYLYGGSRFRGHIGQDLLSKIIKMPFLFFGRHSGMNRKIYKNLENSFNSYDSFKEFIDNNPIKYVLFRKDVAGFQQFTYLKSKIDKNYNIIFQNRLFVVYQTNNKHYILSLPFVETNVMEFLIDKRDMKKINEVKLYLNKNPFWAMTAVNHKIVEKLKNNSILNRFYINFYLIKSIIINRTFLTSESEQENVWRKQESSNFGSEMTYDALIFYKLNVISYITNFFTFCFIILCVAILVFKGFWAENITRSNYDTPLIG